MSHCEFFTNRDQLLFYWQSLKVTAPDRLREDRVMLWVSPRRNAEPCVMAVEQQ